MNSPKKKYSVRLNDDSSRFLYYGGNQLAEGQDLLGKPVAYFFWEFTSAADEGDEKKLLQILGDREILILLYVGIKGGGGKPFTMHEVGDLIYTDFDAKKKYLQAIMCALSVAMTGKDPETIAEEAEAEKKAAESKDEEATPDPT